MFGIFFVQSQGKSMPPCSDGTIKAQEGAAAHFFTGKPL